MKQRKNILLTDEELAAEMTFELKEMVRETKSTESTKIDFVKEIKSGLGNEIKKKGGQVKLIKKTRFQKFIAFLTKIFTKF